MFVKRYIVTFIPPIDVLNLQALPTVRRHFPHGTVQPPNCSLEHHVEFRSHLFQVKINMQFLFHFSHQPDIQPSYGITNSHKRITNNLL